MSEKEYDYVVIGSGFGGSVSALRLSEKGYTVAVIERGKRFGPDDFAQSNWNARKFLWAPKIGCYGIQGITLLRDVMILHGTGVGGGSLVYANTLLVPPDEVFQSPRWNHLGNWKQNLEPHFATAKRMLGVTEARCAGDTDRMLMQIADEMGRADTFHATDVGIYFGQPEVTVPDPYFDGRGPKRTGCNLCGGCMTGCRYGAKNTLDKNYLYLAEKNGVDVFPETEACDVRELGNEAGGYLVDTRQVTGVLFKERKRFKCRGVVFAGGVLGTLPLLFDCKRRGSLKRLSGALGTFVRTNSEALLGATATRRDADYSKGIAIASGFKPDDDTHIEMVRYGKGQDAMSLLATILVGGGKPWPRLLRLIGNIFRHPLQFVRSLIPFGWARKSAILLAMQPLPNHMRVRWRRRWWWPFSHYLKSEWGTNDPVPKYFPVAQDVAQRLAEKMDGYGSSVLPEVVLGLTSTAHILGGCPMGVSAEDGVIDAQGRVFGYDNLYIADGSIIPANLSVNPSLTITALAEWVMANLPAADDADAQPGEDKRA